VVNEETKECVTTIGCSKIGLVDGNFDEAESGLTILGHWLGSVQRWMNSRVLWYEKWIGALRRKQSTRSW
jgi:hypothetical protein